MALVRVERRVVFDLLDQLIYVCVSLT